MMRCEICGNKISEEDFKSSYRECNECVSHLKQLIHDGSKDGVLVTADAIYIGNNKYEVK